MPRRLPRSISVLLLFVLALGSVLPVSAAPGPTQADGPDSLQQADSIAIRLADVEFDPLAGGEIAGLPPELLQDTGAASAGADGTKAYYLVQFDGPITEARLAALNAVGEAFDYIPDFTFIVRMAPASASTIARQTGVRWVGAYLPGFRISRDLLAVAADEEVSAAASVPTDGKQRVTVASGTPEVVADLFPGEALEPVIAAVEGWGGQVLERSQTEWRSKLRLMLPAAHLDDLARLSGVRWIEKAPAWKLYNNKATDIMGGRTVWNNHGLRGTGQVVAIADTGLDKGSTSPAQLHDDFENGSGVSRVSVIHDRVGDGGSDVNSGHGTHVAGSVLGNGKQSGSNPAAHSYPATSYAGLAPEATLVFQALENNTNGSLSGIPLDLNELFTQAASSGAKIHTNSWGSDDAGAYTTDAENVDEYAWNHKDFTILFAAGNAGIDHNADGVIDRFSMGSPASAKNAITVGASENNRPNGSTPTPGYDVPWGTGGWLRFYPADPVRSDHVSNNSNGMAAFSSRGPTLDGRIKPDIVAPGTNIASTLSSLATEESWGPLNADYTFMGGTSMATPLTAGATALVRQFYTDQKSVTPSSALLKATLANGATNIAPGQYGGGATQEIGSTRPTNVAGWGRVNLESTLFPTSPSTLRFADEKNGLTTGASKTFTYNVINAAQPLRVTLAWTDYPGSAAAAGGLVNDLDIHVVGPGGTTYYPNNANPRAPTQHLAYDDGTPSGTYSWSAGKQVAVRFTPTLYPADLQLARFFVGAPYTSDFPKTFNWYVYGGSTSGPSSVIASGSTTIRDFGWHTLDLASRNIRINSGDFFIALQLPDSSMLWAYDSSSPVEGRSWDYNGSAWTAWTQEDYMINAVLTTPPASTQHDRVNNLQGIDIATPALGTYQIVVKGYNVARGPQPYALVVSGALEDPQLPPMPYDLYLPLALNKYPPVPETPVLNAIDNGDGDGNYIVTWNPAGGAVNYILVEDDNPAFSSPTTVYGPGPGTSWQASAKPVGTYYYRVAGTNSWGQSGWSNTQSATVLPPSLPTRLDSVADATVLSTMSGTNFGTYDDILTGYDECDAFGVWRAMLKFDLSAIPSSTQIASARLSVNLIESCDYPNRTRPLTVYRLGGGWTETGLTWANQPSILESFGTTNLPSRGWGRYTIDVTGLVRGWINGSMPNNGLVLRTTEAVSSESASMGFGSRELGGDYMPYLEITYAGAAAATAPTAEPAQARPQCDNSVLDLFPQQDAENCVRCQTRACDAP